MLRRGARVAVAALLAGCAAAPYTRRSQLILISPEEENKLGARAFQQVLGKSHPDGRAQVNGPVEAVGQRLARVAERPDYEWRFVAIDDPKQQNAFCLPGGKVAVYTGIFPIAESTNGLAVVLGHEIAHALARHGAERISQGLVTQAGGSLLGAWLGGGPGTNTILAAYGLGAQLGVLLPYSRTQGRDPRVVVLVEQLAAQPAPRLDPYGVQHPRPHFEPDPRRASEDPPRNAPQAGEKSPNSPTRAFTRLRPPPETPHRPTAASSCARRPRPTTLHLIASFE